MNEISCFATKEERDALLRKVYQKRILIDHVEQYLASDLIKLITGPRRAGKSVFALQLLGSNDFAYLNFDDELLLSSFDENCDYSGFAGSLPSVSLLAVG
jgi:predicted AAA+ superfamily ATPase